MDRLASAIRELRSKLGYSQAEMARRLGISLRGIANYEAGSRRPGAETLHALSKLAGAQGLGKLEHIFDQEFDQEVASQQIKGVRVKGGRVKGQLLPVTSEERALVAAVLLLLRSDTFPAKAQSLIIERLEALNELKSKLFSVEPEVVENVVVELRCLASPTAEERVNILAEAKMRRTGATKTQAVAAVIRERPALAAQVEDEAGEKTAERKTTEEKTKERRTAK
jgi:transcriptional regulator with XRE-family HTH domain